MQSIKRQRPLSILPRSSAPEPEDSGAYLLGLLAAGMSGFLMGLTLGAAIAVWIMR